MIFHCQRLDFTRDLYQKADIAQYKLKIQFMKVLSLFMLLVMSQFMWSQENIATQNDDLSHSIDVPVWYLKTQDKNVNLFVKEIGSGDTVIFVHGGFGAEHSYLLDALNGLENSFHFIYYDQRGSLRSPAADSLITLEQHIEDIELLRKELNIKRLNILGHSMGTLISSFYLEKYPDNVKSLTLLALAYPKTPSSEEEAQLFEDQKNESAAFVNRSAIQEELEEEGLNRDRTSFSNRDVSNDWRIRFAGVNIYHVERWRKVKGGMVFYNQKAGTAAGRSLPESWNHIETFKASGIPITVINGTHDFVDLGGKVYSQLLSDIDNVEYILLDKAGHNAWIDRPDVFKDIVKKGLLKHQSMANKL